MYLHAPYHRRAVRHIDDGLTEGELCVPCQRAFHEGECAGFARIGTADWLNDGYEGYDGCEGLEEPLLYCDCCRHVSRAREFSRRQIGSLDTESVLQEPFGDCDDPMRNVFLHDDYFVPDEKYENAMLGYKVGKSEYSRTVRHHWADITLIKSWLSDCEDRHGDVCNAHRQTPNEAGTLLLVDVLNDCLSVGSFECRYFALSYVWGASEQFLTLVKNYGRLCKPGSLSMQPLTQTIKDAMSFVGTMGERYLWIDTMCIIQDDKQNKAVAIAQMCSIYSRAIATIIALTGDSADNGLPGVPPTARNNTARYAAPGLHITERSFLDQLLQNHTYNHVHVDCIYNTRAWTYQERLLSNRSIIFLKEQVYFQCKKHLLCEDRVGSDSSTVYSLENIRQNSAAQKVRAARKSTYSPFDEFRWYEKIVVEYTSKRMGYPDDIINAFTGVQTELQNMFGWTFIAGLPPSLLDLALLWTPVTTVQRRVTALHHASWSWSGWIGSVRYNDMIRPGDRPLGSIFRSLGSRNMSEQNAIVFGCMSVNLSALELMKAPNNLLDPFGNNLITEDSYFIFDKEKRRCGIVIGLPEQVKLCSESSTFKLLLLSTWRVNNSYTTYGPLIAQLLEDGNLADEALYDSAFRDAEWCTYNFMLVSPVGPSLSERIAVGQMHVDAWSEAGEAWGKFTVQ